MQLKLGMFRLQVRASNAVGDRAKGGALNNTSINVLEGWSHSLKFGGVFPRIEIGDQPIVHFIVYVKLGQFVKEGGMLDRVKCLFGPEKSGALAKGHICIYVMHQLSG